MSVKRLSQIPALVYEKLAKELIDDWEIVGKLIVKRNFLI